ncbi:glycosyl hydrolase family 16 [Jejuia pallidilutea]|uniref:Glycosyl hydrolase family 16 n=1 Tax=Jejuia pallidilutea TaxID=504487 RepID=A0A362XCJ2_9FLAO|nr:glycoside hydrolase family 16 protein [Jejuia pallidilutea]PQV48833.1 glycosyl hydrolase family 16 [Jejuia pallidilutea]
MRKKMINTVLLIVLLTLNSCFNKDKKTSLDKNKKTDSIALIKESLKYNPDENWELVWADEFEKPNIDTTNWSLQVVEAGRFNDEWQRYTNSPKNAYIDNGALVIKTIHESDVHGKDQYTSARLHTANKQTWKYGKISARIKLPYGEGIWPAFWMLGANINENGGDTPWPQCGEIDIIELFGYKDDSAVEAHLHYADEFGLHKGIGKDFIFKLEKGKFADAFHIFTLEWDADKISWFVDGVQFASVPITDDTLSEFHNNFFILFNIAVGGTHAGRPNDTTIFPQYMYVDWVRVYKKKSRV